MKHLRLYGLMCILCLLWAMPMLTQDTPSPEETETPEIAPERCDILFAPDDVDLAYYVGQGDVRFAQGNYTSAINAYTCALIIDPQFILALNARGYAHLVQGNDEAALADFDAILAVDEINVLALTNRAVLYTRQGRFGLALSDFDLAIALAPDLAVAYNNRAVIHAAEANYDLAIADVQQAIALDPVYPEPHATLGMIYSALAVNSYAQFTSLKGENSLLPAGTADNVIIALNDSRETGSYFVWLAVQTPAS